MTPSTQPAQPEIHPTHPPVVPIPQDPFIPTGRLQRIVNLFPKGQFVRYLCVGVFNTLFGYSAFVVMLSVLTHLLPRWPQAVLAVLGSVLSTPLSITVAYFGYKFFVFRTKGNYLFEWLKCFAVYGTGMLPGLVVLGALTRLLQSVLHSHAHGLHALLTATESHLSGAPLALVAHTATGKSMAGYIAGAITICFSTIFSFIGHKKVTFKQKQST